MDVKDVLATGGVVAGVAAVAGTIVGYRARVRARAEGSLKSGWSDKAGELSDEANRLRANAEGTLAALKRPAAPVSQP